MKTYGVIATGILLVLPMVGMADSAIWDEEKIEQVEQNREANSGLGDGGEVELPNGNWVETPSEEGRFDQDPGSSGDNCQGGKNASAC